MKVIKNSLNSENTLVDIFIYCNCKYKCTFILFATLHILTAMVLKQYNEQ